MSTYRFKARSTSTGQYRFKTGFFAGLPATTSVLFGVDRGDGSTGALLPSLLSGGGGSITLSGTIERGSVQGAQA